jgi:thioredoxin 1
MAVQVGRGDSSRILILQRGRSAAIRRTDDATEHTMANAVEVTDDNFATEIEAHQGLAVVDFWATWCAPCRMIAPIVEQLAGEYAGKAKVAKLDVDNNQRTAARFNVRSIPTILFFKDGKLIDQVVGAVPRPALEAKFKEHA